MIYKQITACEMKTNLIKSIALLILTLAFLQINTSVFAQAPQKMSYQAVIKDASNSLIIESSIGIKISILQSAPNGTLVYSETQTPTSNSNGLISIEIGNAIGFDTIHWENGPFFIKTETDPFGGTDYSIVGISQLMSVPYALYSASGNPGPKGDKGDVGSQGSTILYGASDPDILTGRDGDYFINFTTNTFWGPKISDNWITNFSLVGPQGLQGIQGLQGEQGLQGIQGNDGATGQQGDQGIQGLQGIQGIQGEQGIQGLIGDVGPQGIQGIQGEKGDTGVAGIQGPQGLPGLDGEDGIQGIQGEQGIAGTNGKTLLYGTNDPSSGIGTDDDFFINITNYTFFGPKTTGDWGTGISLIGPQGNQGIQGEIGPQGEKGEPGLSGDKYTTTSTTSLAISTGAKTLTVETNLALSIGQTVIIANSASNKMEAVVTSYNSTNGELNVDVTNITGSGTFSTWNISLNGAAGPAGPMGLTGAAGPQGPVGPTGFLSNGTSAGNTPYWNGTSWVLNNSNIFNNGGNIGIGTTSPLGTLDLRGTLLIPSGLTNASTRPEVNNLRIQGEISGVGGGPISLGRDDGFLRISSGGGTSVTGKSYIDLTSWSSVADMNRNIVLGTSSVERMRITNNGLIGIGTSTPTALFDVTGTTSSDTKMHLLNTGTGNVVMELRSTGDCVQVIDFSSSSTSNAGNGTPDYQNRIMSSWTNIKIINPLNPAGIVLLRTGNVGIGTLTPATKLDVVGQINSSTGYQIGGLAASGYYLRGDGTNFISSQIQASDLPSGNSNYIQNQSSIDQSASFRINGSGTIGAVGGAGTSLLKVGTSSTDFSDFKIVAAGSGQLEHIGWASGWNINTMTPSKNLYINRDAPSSNNVIIGRIGFEVFVKGSDGNVGIGTLTPVNKLDIEGGLAVGATFSGTKTSPTNGVIIEGNVGIGTSTPLGTLDVRGSLLIPSGLTNASTRPTVGTTRIQGEIAGVGGATPALGWSDGFLRLSAGGGTSIGSKSFIDISGSSLDADMNLNIVLGTANLERMRISKNGFIGIGTATPTALLDVTGNTPADTKIHFLNTSTGNVGLELRSTGAGALQFIDFSNSSIDNTVGGNPDFKQRILAGDNNITFLPKHQIVINSPGSGLTSSDNTSYPLFVTGSSQGISIQVTAATPNNTNNFITFRDNANVIRGRIEGQTSTEVQSDPDYVFDNAMTTLSTGFGAAMVIVDMIGIDDFDAAVAEAFQIGLQTAQWQASLNAQIANAGVSYASGSGDYAEYLERINKNEEISAGDIVSVIGGKISKNTQNSGKLMAVSTSPIVLGNMPKEGEEQNFEKVAFMGQVPVKVIGFVKIGDFILSSGQNDGLGYALNPKEMKIEDYSKIVGVAWSEAINTNGISLINTAVGFNSNDLVDKLSEQKNEISQLKNQMSEITSYLKEKDPNFKLENNVEKSEKDRIQNVAKIDAINSLQGKVIDYKQLHNIYTENKDYFSKILENAKNECLKQGIDIYKYPEVAKMFDVQHYIDWAADPEKNSFKPSVK